ncbi:RHS repeat-associated core domain-containing protein [Burkholderia stagnalis]|uniref:RHS repeat-associated core domain-containing protein n=1 Tax=Burkholderia stagnalis TaxID=1503054 RepID=UPI0013E02B98|nr:RHS repeat-associated core domain-containing protein [Burkholderia stagnalis]
MTTPDPLAASPSAAVHSNAFNFLSFVDAGVDPRTGFYTFSIALPNVMANDLTGPALPLSLAFNPLQTDDRGVGIGWSLRVSHYDRIAKQLRLSTGETYRAVDTGPRIVVEDQKLQNFRVDKIDGDLRIVYKNGVTERLSNAGAHDVYLPSAIHSPEGRALSLRYTMFRGHRLLSEVRDDSRRLLALERTDTQAAITLLPDAPDAATFTLVLRNDRVTEIRLPVDNRASWRLQYETLGDLTLISQVESPTGGVETVRYQAQGHELPAGAPLRYLPYAIEHVRMPRADQPRLRSLYRYTRNNFMGYGAPGLVWKDGEDNLYKVLDDYRYGSDETHVTSEGDATEAVRVVHRTFNRFHLLVSEETNQRGHVALQRTEYDEKPGRPFSEQSPQCQLPLRATKSWYLSAAPGTAREEVVTTRFDDWGNLLEQVDAAGTVEQYDYYPAEGDTGCPPDPLGFVRFVRTKRVTPAPGPVAAPTVATRYTYAALPSLQPDGPSHVVVADETLSEVTDHASRDLQHIARTWLDTPTDALLHGRVATETKTLGGIATRTAYVYALQDDALCTTTTVTGFDGTTRTSSAWRALATGQNVRVEDESGVTIRYAYDALGRVLAETTAPGTEYEATRRHTYGLAATADDPVYASVTDALGVTTRTAYDGLNRVVRIDTADVDHADEPMRTTYRARYDALGQLVEETQTDWLDGEPLALVSRHRYDDWGERNGTTRPDGVDAYRVQDPIRRTETEWLADGAGTRTGRTVTTRNAFDKPVSIERFDTRDAAAGVTVNEYDGLGRCVRRTDPAGNVSTFAYDAFGRMTRNVLPDGVAIEHAYAAHDSDALPIRIGVADSGGGRTIVAGEQAFDGLGRLARRTVGGRVRVFAYEGSHTQPNHEITPSGASIRYAYTPSLTRQPIRRSVADLDDDYTYHPVHAQLVRARSAATDDEYGLDYLRSGQLLSEHWREDGDAHHASRAASLEGRPLRYTDRFGDTQTNGYDVASRLTRVQGAALDASLQYDGFGRLRQCTTRDADSGRTLTVTLAYDDFGRETERRIVQDGAPPVVIAQTHTPADKLARRTLSAGDTIVRDETHEYDARGRLVAYRCTGTQLPNDPYGHAIASQQYTFDSLDNLNVVTTEFGDGTRNVTRFSYGNETDPTQLTRVTHSHADYPPTLELRYDADGNLVDDGSRTYQYDPLGRLTRIAGAVRSLSAQYRYDALDRLVAIRRSDGVTVRRTYRDARLVSELRDGERIGYLRADERLLAHRRDGTQAQTVLYGIDQQQSVLLAVSGGEHRDLAYTPYGYRATDTDMPGLPGFNGEPLDPLTGGYLLGNGHRLYDPVLMRFHRPDTLSPFDGGGLNPYAYCLGDPINRIDPTGQLSWQAILGIVLGAVVIALTVVSLGAGAAIAAGVAPATGMLGAIATVPSMTVSGVVSVAAGVAGLAEGATTIASAALSERDGKASGILGWVSLGLGVASAANGVAGAASKVAGASKGVVSTTTRNLAVARAAIDVTARTHGVAGQFVSTFVDDVPAWASHTMMGVSLALTAAGWGGLAREAALARSTGFHALADAPPADASGGQPGRYRSLAEAPTGAADGRSSVAAASDGVRQRTLLVQR